MMKHGIHSYQYDDEDVISEDNIDLSLLSVNKAFNATASEILYSQNQFVFFSADPCS